MCVAFRALRLMSRSNGHLFKTLDWPDYPGVIELLFQSIVIIPAQGRVF
jgi:hypothetical protein